MCRVLLLALLIAAGCSDQKSEASSRKAAENAETTPKKEGPCPRGAELGSDSTPGGPRVTFCRRKDGAFVGPYTVVMPDGVKTAEGQFDKGKETGHWVLRHVNGKVWKEGDYVEGLRDGTWKVYNDEGKALGAFHMKRGTGTRMRWWKNGNRRQAIEMRNGRRHGKTTWWRETGEKLMAAHYKDGRLDGDWTYWDIQGRVRKIEDWHDDQIEGTVWYKDGKPLVPK